MADWGRRRWVKKVNPETIIQREIILRLGMMGYDLAVPGSPGALMRMAIGPVIKRGGHAKNPLKGFPDLLGFLKSGNGRAFVIEVKRKEGGSLSDEQKKWLDFLCRQGVLCIVGRSADYVAQILTLAEKAEGEKNVGKTETVDLSIEPEIDALGDGPEGVGLRGDNREIGEDQPKMERRKGRAQRRSETPRGADLKIGEGIFDRV